MPLTKIDTLSQLGLCIHYASSYGTSLRKPKTPLRASFCVLYDTCERKMAVLKVPPMTPRRNRAGRRQIQPPLRRPPGAHWQGTCARRGLRQPNPQKQGLEILELSFEPLSKLLVSPLISPIEVPHMIPYISPFKEFRL